MANFSRGLFVFPLLCGLWVLRSAATGIAAQDASPIASDFPTAIDDECSAEGDDSCALSALQLRAQQDSGADHADRVAGHQEALAHVNASGSGGSEVGDDCFVRAYSGASGGSELCFCQLAGNTGCADSACACPQGCGDGITWQNSQTVSFKNKARSSGCPDGTVILTSPRSYFKDPADLKHHAGGGCAVSIITQLLLDSWDTYQENVSEGPVWQCFHGSHIASVSYLHLQTFCKQGNFHGMPTRNHYVASCVAMSSKDQAKSLAPQLAGMIGGR